MKAKQAMKLRRTAERQLASSSTKRLSLPSSASALRHELQVHHIELELQNDELHRAQADLERSRDRYRDLYDFAPIGYFSLDGAGLIVSINHAAAALLRIDRADQQPRRFVTLVARADLQRWATHLALLREGPARTCELTLEPGKGPPFVAQLSSVMAVELDDVATIRCTLLDVTARHQAEEERARRFEEMVDLNHLLRQREAQLVRADKLVSVGRLAAGVAQGIKSPLGALAGRLVLMQKCLAELSLGSTTRDPAVVQWELEGHTADAQQYLGLVNGVVSSLTAFTDARSESVESVEDVELQVLVDGATRLLMSTVDSTLMLKHEPWWQPLQLRCRPLQLHQVVTNLLLNATRATAPAGTITVRTGRDGDEVWIEVEDHGPTLSREQLGRLFEPFVAGAGLGLAVAQDIVRQHGGRIEVHSAPGAGSTFRVVLPMAGPAET